MAEFVQTMKDWKRMCKSMQKKNMSCKEDCLLGHNPTCGELEYASLEEINNAETVIMKWAAEHPVVYPTWEEWLITQGVIKENPTDGVGWPMPKLLDPIPADIAQKLGIKPKEDV